MGRGIPEELALIDLIPFIPCGDIIKGGPVNSLTNKDAGAGGFFNGFGGYFGGLSATGLGN